MVSFHMIGGAPVAWVPVMPGKRAARRELGVISCAIAFRATHHDREAQP